MNNITYQLEHINSVLEEIKPLNIAHYEEVGAFKEFDLNPAYDIYEQLEKDGLLIICTVRKDMELIGYSIDQLLPSLHYQPKNFAYNDVIYVKPEYRNGFIALKLLKFETDRLKERNIHVHLMHMKVKHKFNRLVERLGYQEMDLIYTKILGDE